MPQDLPQCLVKNIVEKYGEAGVLWLAELPNIVRFLSKQWAFTPQAHYDGLSYHYVAPCLRDDGTGAVVKIAIPEPETTIFREKSVLQSLDGRGAVRALDFDAQCFALLLERLTPGEDLRAISQVDDDRATSVAIDLMKRIHSQPVTTDGFPSLEEWADDFRKAADSDLTAAFGKANKFFDGLIGSSNRSHLLHGDLHHQNILSAEREPFLAIDPKGILGDLGFEISVFLNNPRGWLLSHPNRNEIVANRIKQFSEAFDIAPYELKKWAFAEAALSAWWTLDDNSADWEKWLACTTIWNV